MKFAHQYQIVLEREAFPTEWINSAISYRQLKKCINEVQRELASIGLDPSTLSQLSEAAETGRSPASNGGNIGNSPASFQYLFQGDRNLPKPKLLCKVNKSDGVLLDARLSPETKEYLCALAVRQRHCSYLDCRRDTDLHAYEQNFDGVLPTEASGRDSCSPARSQSKEDLCNDCTVHFEDERGVAWIEIPLTADSAFFTLLRKELASLNGLQTREQAQVTERIMEVGQTIEKVTAPTASRSKTDLYRWREIFELYVEANVFFSTNEQDTGSRNAAEAAKQLQWVSDEIKRRRLDRNFKTKQSGVALERFMMINAILLRNLKFQEINHTAMIKILKKFDKRTALSARTKFPELLQGDAFLSRTMAKAICFKVSEKILSAVPQLDDYLCPICFNISFKPVRLTCGHVFCIRCLITMQRAQENHCPLCRGDVVMSADSTNLDPALINFLKTYFPDEVKAKQRENERAMGIDTYGRDYARCCVM